MGGVEYSVLSFARLGVLQLLKTLPKDIRRQIVPVPDTAKQIFDMLEKNHHGGLLRQLCDA